MSKQSGSNFTESDEWSNQSPSKKKKRKIFVLEYRWNPHSKLSNFFRQNEWRTYRKYSTEEQRQQAYETLTRKDTYCEYRIPNEIKEN